MSWRRWLAPVAVVLVLTACSSSSDGTGPPAPPAVSTPASSIWPCLSGIKARVGSASPTLRMALLGVSPRVVVFSNENDANLCAWVRFASTLVNQGYTSVLYDYTGNPIGDLTNVVRYLRTLGTGWIGFVGASEGAKAAIVTATRLRPGPTVLISLSAEANLDGSPVAPYAARLNTPTLFVTAATDPYGATAATRSFYAAAPSTDKQLLVQPGTQHGAALLSQVPVQDAVFYKLRAAAS